MVKLPKNIDTKPLTMEDIMKVSSKKPAYKMKKSEIIMELNDVYDVVIDKPMLKRELVHALQSHRMGSCCDACQCVAEQPTDSWFKSFFNRIIMKWGN